MATIDPRRVSRGIITLQAALASRDATFEGIESIVAQDGVPMFVARATVRSGGKLEVASAIDEYDAAERLLTLATRQPARSGFGW